MALDSSTILWSEAKASILRPLGKQTDPAADTAAGEALRSTLLNLGNKRNWTFLNTVTVLNCPTTGLITLPTRFKKFYSATIPALRPLWMMTKRQYDLYNPMGQALGGTYIYIPYDTYLTGMVQIRDAPTNAVSVTVNYNRRPFIPVNNASTFDLPENVMAYVLADAKLRIGPDYNATGEQMTMWREIRNIELSDLIASDVSQPDMQIQFHGSQEWCPDGSDDWGNSE